MKQVFSPAAQKDLFEIHAYIGRRNPANAKRFIQKLKRICKLLSQEPSIGRVRDDIAPALLSFAYGNYLIFYRVSQDTIEIARVLEGHRDYESTWEG